MAIGCLRIGLDDTDAPGGLCTTWLGAVLARRLEAAGVPVRERRLVRLNPNAPFRTRGNAAIALLAEGDPALAFELACAAVEEFAPLDAPMTNPGVVVADRPLPETCYRRAVTDLCTVGDTVDVLDAAGARYRGYGNGRGLIGAAAAVAAEFPDRTYGLLAYRERTRWGTPREVDAASLFRAEAARPSPEPGTRWTSRTTRSSASPTPRPGPLRDPRREPGVGRAGTLARPLRAGRHRGLLDDEPGDRRPPRRGAVRSAPGGAVVRGRGHGR